MQSGRLAVRAPVIVAKRRAIIALRAALKGSEGHIDCGGHSVESCLLNGRESTNAATNLVGGGDGSPLSVRSSLRRSKAGRSGGRNRSLAVGRGFIIYGGGRATLPIRSPCSDRSIFGIAGISSIPSGGRSHWAVFSPATAMTISLICGPSGCVCPVVMVHRVCLLPVLPVSRSGSGRPVCRMASITAIISRGAPEASLRPIRCLLSRISSRCTSFSATTVNGLVMYSCPTRS